MHVAVTVEFRAEGITVGVAGFGADIPAQVLADAAARVASSVAATASARPRIRTNDIGTSTAERQGLQDRPEGAGNLRA